MFNIRYLKEDDYDLLCSWWRAWRWTPPARDFLPENGCGGFMVSKEDIDIVAGFVYFTNSKIAWCEFIISNFDFKDRKDRKEALKILIYETEQLVRSKGAKYIYISVKNKNLENAYKEMGFIMGSRQTNELIRVL